MSAGRRYEQNIHQNLPVPFLYYVLPVRMLRNDSVSHPMHKARGLEIFSCLTDCYSKHCSKSVNVM